MQQDDTKPVEVHEELADAAGPAPETSSDEKFAAVERALLPQPTNDPNDPLVGESRHDHLAYFLHMFNTASSHRIGRHGKSTRRT